MIISNGPKAVQKKKKSTSMHRMAQRSHKTRTSGWRSWRMLLKEQKKNGSPGPDNIKAIALEHVSITTKYFMLTLFNAIWRSGRVPEIWRHAIVVPILKPGKSRHDPENYRLISLTNVICKVMEKIVPRRFMWYLESNSKISNFQYGFRKYLSTADPIQSLTNMIHSSFH